jgi:hypothetical protein
LDAEAVGDGTEQMPIFQFENRGSKTRRIVIEPLCEEFDVPPGSTFEVNAAQFHQPTCFELYDDQITLWIVTDLTDLDGVKDRIITLDGVEVRTEDRFNRGLASAL